MITLTASDAVHKAWLYRLLIAIVDNKKLNKLYFKGGTAAAMAGYLDRFSVDLDFDYVGDINNLLFVRQELKKIFRDLGFEIKDSSNKAPQFFLKYKTNKPSLRNTLKVDISFPVFKDNKYEAIKLVDINRIVICQNISTMFANKLVAVADRYKKNNSIAGRDIYDIHHFFLNSYNYNTELIMERTKLSVIDYFSELLLFINKNINNTILEHDLNFLLPYDNFCKLKKSLKLETEMFIKEEIKRLKKDLF